MSRTSVVGMAEARIRLKKIHSLQGHSMGKQQKNGKIEPRV
jgi:hypothetical protein